MCSNHSRCTKGLPYLAALLISEYIVLWIQNKQVPRFNDSITSLSIGLLHECSKYVTYANEFLTDYLLSNMGKTGFLCED